MMQSNERTPPRVVEFPARCVVLDSLPNLPVRVLVISGDGVESEGRRRLAERLERTAASLGVASGLVVAERSVSDWSTGGVLAQERFDVIFVRPGSVPADGEDVRVPSQHVVGGLFSLLGDSRSRFWLLDSYADDPEDGDSQLRSEALCRIVVSQGGPPAVLVPLEWESDRRIQFHESLLEWSLHDAPLDLAVTRATGDSGPPPVLFLPSGRRHGLDLGRLLEDYRRRIDETGAALQMLSVELAALGPGHGDEKGAHSRLEQSALAWAQSLELVKHACDEINRDRDPAGWSRLRSSLDQLEELEATVAAAREETELLRADSLPLGDSR